MSEESSTTEITIDCPSEKVFDILQKLEDYGQFLEAFIILTKKNPEEWIQVIPSEEEFKCYRIFTIHPMWGVEQGFGYVRFNINSEDKTIRWSTFAKPESKKLPWYRRTSIMWFPLLVLSIMLFMLFPLWFVLFLHLWFRERQYKSGYGLPFKAYGSFKLKAVDEKQTHLIVDYGVEFNMYTKLSMALLRFPIRFINFILHLMTTAINFVFKTSLNWQLSNPFSEEAWRKGQIEGVKTIAYSIKKHAEFYA